MSPGEWCPILIRNALSNGDPNSAIAHYVVNYNTTGILMKT